MLDPEFQKRINETDRRQREETKVLALSDGLTLEAVQGLQRKYISIFRGLVLEAQILSSNH